jgi:HPt (histidine-containing phosphotransfer) domain-containing protein
VKGLFEERMNALRESFLLRAAGDHERIAGALDPLDLETLRTVSHKLAGIAGTFGFVEIGAAAESLEDAIDEHLPTDEVRRRCENLRGALAQAAPDA